MSFLKNRKAICLLTTVFVFLSIFSTGFAQTSKAEAPATLRIGWSVEADSLSPFISYTQAGAEVFYLIYDSLVKFDEEFNPVGNLAETWDLSGDQLTWTFKLREGVKWHDGEPLTSEDVKLTYEYMLESGLGMYCDFVTGIESIECPDEHTVVIKTEKPKANMLMNPAPILPMHI